MFRSFSLLVVAALAAAGCGAGADTAISDRRSLDAVDADCDSVDALPEPAGQGGGPAPADTSLSFSLGGAKVQRVLRQRGLRVRVRCSLEPCTTVTAVSATLRRARTSRGSGGCGPRSLDPVVRSTNGSGPAPPPFVAAPVPGDSTNQICVWGR